MEDSKDEAHGIGLKKENRIIECKGNMN